MDITSILHAIASILTLISALRVTNAESYGVDAKGRSLFSDVPRQDFERKTLSAEEIVKNAGQRAKQHSRSSYFKMLPNRESYFEDDFGFKTAKQLMPVVNNGTPSQATLSPGTIAHLSTERNKILNGLPTTFDHVYPFYGSYVAEPSISATDQALAFASNVYVPIYKIPLPRNNEAFVNANDKLISSMPITQFPSTPDTQNYLRILGNRPSIAAPNYGSNLGLNFASAVDANSAYRSVPSTFQGQIIPIQTSIGNWKFPRYKGASVETFPVSTSFLKTPPTYEALQMQPQLHFNVAPPVAVNPAIANFPARTAEGIRGDVEMVKKKKPPFQKNESEFDEGYKSIESEYGANSEEEEQQREEGEEERSPSDSFQQPPTEGDFVPSKYFPFEHDNEKFAKYSNHKEESDEEGDEEEEEEEERAVAKLREQSRGYGETEGEKEYSGESAEYYRFNDNNNNNYRSEGENAKDSERGEKGSEENLNYRVYPKEYEQFRKNLGLPSEKFEDSYAKGHFSEPKAKKNRGESGYASEESFYDGDYKVSPKVYSDSEDYGSAPSVRIIPERPKNEVYRTNLRNNDGKEKKLTIMKAIKINGQRHPSYKGDNNSRSLSFLQKGMNLSPASESRTYFRDLFKFRNSNNEEIPRDLKGI